MRKLTRRVTLPLITLAVFAALVVAGLCIAAVTGISQTTAAGNDVTRDELATLAATARAGFAIDRAYASGLRVAYVPSGAPRTATEERLYSVLVPEADDAVAGLQRTHQADPPGERRGVQLFATQWQHLRALLGPDPLSGRVQGSLAAALTSAYRPIAAHLADLLAKEDRDARREETHASSNGDSMSVGIAVGSGVGGLLALLLGWAGARRVRRAVEPEQAQVEFGETLQVAADEEEAYQLLQRHLERSLSPTSAAVLNRNNSADRLEAVTPLPHGSCLSSTLRGATPSSCLAIRAGRLHRVEPGREGLLSCAVCSSCDGATACMPVIVGGEVIGSVLLNAPDPFDDDRTRRAVESIGQAAPVIANLRNLAVAELRASTDALTGLPNKRAVGETMKRMFAQASRTGSPLTVVLIDLDHFKAVNDRFGHPFGDQVLATVGAVLREGLRAGDFAGRYGGEEFALLLPDTDVQSGFEVAERLRTSLSEAVHPGLDEPVTASLGLATYPDHAGSLERIERLADAALYIAKRSGRDRTEMADPSGEHNPGPGPEGDAHARAGHGAPMRGSRPVRL